MACPTKAIPNMPNVKYQAHFSPFLKGTKETKHKVKLRQNMYTPSERCISVNASIKSELKARISDSVTPSTFPSNGFPTKYINPNTTPKIATMNSKTDATFKTLLMTITSPQTFKPFQ